MLLYNLDIEGVAISSGSACSSGSNSASHVLKAINISNEFTSLRISFCKYSTFDEIDVFINLLKRLL